MTAVAAQAAVPGWRNDEPLVLDGNAHAETGFKACGLDPTPGEL
jgi:hypothetical protein